MSATFEHRQWGEVFHLQPVFGQYANGRLAIQLFGGGEPFATVTVNLPDEHLNDGEVFIKDWAENEMVVARMVENGWLIPAGREVQSGFVFPKVMRLGGSLYVQQLAARSADH